MSRVGPNLAGRILATWVDLMVRGALWVVIGFTLATGWLLYYAGTHLGINTSTTDMISERLAWRQAFVAYQKAFPQFAGNVLVLIEGETPDLADDARARLAAALASEPDRYESMLVPGGGEFFARNGLLYLEVEALEELADNLTRAQPLLGRIARDPTLEGLVAMLELALDTPADGSRTDLAPVLQQMEAAVAATREGRFHQLSWQELASARPATAAERRRLIVLRPRLDFSEPEPRGAAIAHVREHAHSLGLDEQHGVRVRLTGPVALEYEELRSVTRGMGLAGGLALVMVAGTLWIALRSFRLVAASLATLVAGLVATGGFAAWAVGHLNLISMAFAVLYIGLGIDFAIHLCLRYRELMEQGREHAAALREAASDVGASLVLCAVTTSVGFFAFFPTDFAGVRELGLISGTGMYISLLATLSLLPALLTLTPLDPAKLASTRVSERRVSRLLALPLAHRRAVRMAALVLGLASLAAIPLVEFDHNPLNLRNPDTESVAAFKDLSAGTSPPLTLSVLTEDGQRIAELAARLEALDLVDRVETLEDLVPKDQDEKLAIIDDLALVLGPGLTRPSDPLEVDAEQSRARLSALRARLARVLGSDELGPAARALEAELARFDQALETESGDRQREYLQTLEASLLGALPRRLRLLDRALQAEPVAVEDLPPEIVALRLSPDGQQRLEIFPAEDISHNEASRRLIAQTRSVAPEVTGLPVLQLGAGQVVVEAFQQAFVSALVLISVLLLLLLRSLRATLLVLGPMALAAALTAAAAVLSGIHFNFANVIALPLLLGVGVDNGIHMVHRSHTMRAAGESLVATSTARAVLFSALTTIFSFGNLAFSSHPGTASMGRLLALGMAFNLLTTLVVLPALIRRVPAPGAEPK